MAAALGATFESWQLLKAFTLVILSLPLFWNLGLAGVIAFIFSGRGLGTFQQLGHLAAVFAGVYFPLLVFPDWLRLLSRTVSPLTLIVENSRAAQIETGPFVLMIILSISSCFIFPSLLAMATKHLARSGRRLILNS